MSRVPADVRRGLLSADEKASIITLADRGLGAGRIALRLNRHPSTVNFAMHYLGLRSPVARTFSYRRGDHTVRSFSPEEDAMIQALRVAQVNQTEIARRVTARFGYRRTPATIRVRLVLLANLEECA